MTWHGVDWGHKHPVNMLLPPSDLLPAPEKTLHKATQVSFWARSGAGKVESGPGVNPEAAARQCYETVYSSQVFLVYSVRYPESQMYFDPSVSQLVPTKKTACIHLSKYPSIHPPLTHSSEYPPIHQPTHSFLHPSIFPSIHPLI